MTTTTRDTENKSRPNSNDPLNAGTTSGKVGGAGIGSNQNAGGSQSGGAHQTTTSQTSGNSNRAGLTSNRKVFVSSKKARMRSLIWLRRRKTKRLDVFRAFLQRSIVRRVNSLKKTKSSLAI